MKVVRKKMKVVRDADCFALTNKIAFTDEEGFHHLNKAAWRGWRCPTHRKHRSSAAQTYYRQTLAMIALGINATYRCAHVPSPSKIFPWKSHISTHISSDKILANLIAKFVGFSAATSYNINSKKAFEDVFPRLDFPVVVKPRRGLQGIGVVLNVSKSQLLRLASLRSYRFIIESQLPKLPEYRLFVIDGHLVHAVERRRAVLRGRDGVMLSALIREVNAKRASMLETFKRYPPPAKDVQTFANKTYTVSTLVNSHQGGQVFQVDHVPKLWHRVAAELATFFPIYQRMLAIDVIASPRNENPRKMYIVEVNEAPGVTMAFTARGTGCPMSLDFKMAMFKFRRRSRPTAHNRFAKLSLRFFAKNKHNPNIAKELATTLASLV